MTQTKDTSAYISSIIESIDKNTAIGPVLAVLAHFSGIVDPKHSESRLQDVFEVQSDLSKPSCSSL